MTKFFSILGLLVVVTVSVKSSAYDRYHDWHRYWWPVCSAWSNTNIINQRIQSVSSCKLIAPELIRTHDNTLNLDADAWQGGYEKIETVVTTFRISSFEDCGRGTRVTGSSVGTQSSNIDLRYTLTNPNLDPSVTQSYVAALAPFTDGEVQTALGQLQTVCQKPVARSILFSHWDHDDQINMVGDGL